MVGNVDERYGYLAGAVQLLELQRENGSIDEGWVQQVAQARTRVSRLAQDTSELVKTDQIFGQRMEVLEENLQNLEKVSLNRQSKCLREFTYLVLPHAALLTTIFLCYWTPGSQNYPK